MAASLMNMLDDLEARLERTQAELQALRGENQRLKQRLALQDAQAPNQPSQPSQEKSAIAEPHSETVSAHAALERETLEGVTSENSVLEGKAQEKQAPANSPSESGAPVQEAVEQPESKQAEPVPEPPVQPAPGQSTQTPSPHALLNQWYDRYPKAFFKGHTKPLKVGIHQDLAAREEWSNKLIRRALANYVNLPRYIKAVRVGAERVDLDGQPAGKVDKEAAQHASEKRGDKQEQGVKNERMPPQKTQPTTMPVAPKPRHEAVKQAENKTESEKSEPRKALSLEDKLLGLQQKFKGR